MINNKRRHRLEKGPGPLVYIILILYSFIIIFPFLIVVITSIKTWQEASSIEFHFFPKEGLNFSGYKEVFTYKANYEATMPTVVKSFFNTLL